ncbi:MAG: transglutaminase domain-containing protein [Armatimonadota bacterium]
MKKILIAAFIILAVFCSVFSIFSRNNLNGSGLKTCSIYHISYNINFKNGSDAPSELFCIVPEIKNIYPRQKIYNFSINHKYQTISIPHNNNKAYLIKINEFNPGKEANIRINFNAKIFHIENKPELRQNKTAIDGLHLKEEPDIETNSENIKKTALDITKNESNDYYKLIKLYDFTRTKLLYAEDKKCSSALEVLNTRKAQCADSVLLLIALCRSINIPAKFEAGIFYNDKDGKFTKTHSWAQAYVPEYGWLYIDPTLGRFNPESRYCCFGEIRDNYITLWENNRVPFSFYLSNPELDKSKIDVNLSYTIKKIKETKSASPKLNPPRIKDAPGSHKYSISANQRLINNGQAEYSKKNINKAADLFKQAFSKENNSYALKMYINCMESQNQLQKTAAEFNLLTQKYPDNPYYLYAMGLINAYYDNYSIAEDYFKKAVNSGLKDEYIHNSLGYVYIQTKQTSAAKKNLTEALKYSTHYKNIFDNLILLAMMQKNWNNVIFWSNTAMRYNPSYDYNTGIAFAYLNLNDYTKSKQYLDKALMKNPQNTWLNLMLGKIYYSLGDTAGAYEQFKTFIPKATDPEKEEFMPLYEKIKKNHIN